MPAKNHFLALGVDQAERRTQILAARRTVFGSMTTSVGQAGHLVGLRLHGDAFVHVLELDDARHFGDDRVGVRIPLARSSGRPSTSSPSLTVITAPYGIL